LTFDDGPVPEVTPLILDILNRYGWKATFFCVGENVVKHPALYQDVLNQGHAVGNHSFNHMKGFENSTADYVDNVNKAAIYIKSKLFRPPHGRIKSAQIKALKDDYEIIMWDLITYDYNAKLSTETILKTVKKHLRRGSIVVFHDSIKARNNVLSVLPRAIEFWEANGYTFKIL
jgi:peptidoglycan/xylan/chitin deacetylase (PgdA/CDA1 family)